MKYLPQVTLCAVDTRTPDLAWDSLQRSMKDIEFGDVILFTDATTSLPDTHKVRVVHIAPLTSIEAYSHFVMRGLAAHITTSHVLLTQWDGFVRNASAWCDGFLAYDYIGAPWQRCPADSAVGNGGFSLRSRALLDALQDPDFVPGNPEDVLIGQRYRELLQQRYDIRFAPMDVALQFSQERVTNSESSFGFHGAFHLPDVLPSTELRSLVQRIPPSLSRSLDIQDLMLALLARGARADLQIARKLVEKRFTSGSITLHHMHLWCTLIWRTFWVRFPGLG